MDYQQRQPVSPFAMVSLVMGILAIASMCTVFLPIPLGALGILFAVLAYRKGRAMPPQAMAGIGASAAGLLASISICIYSVAMLPTMLQSEQYRDQLNAISEQMYGMSFEEMVEQAYGIDLDELFSSD